MTALADLQCTSPSKSICLAGTTLKKEGVSVPNRADSLRGHTNQEYSHSLIWQFFQLIESSVVFRFKSKYHFPCSNKTLFDLSKILCNEIKKGKNLQLSDLGEFER